MWISSSSLRLLDGFLDNQEKHKMRCQTYEHWRVLCACSDILVLYFQPFWFDSRWTIPLVQVTKVSSIHFSFAPFTFLKRVTYLPTRP